MIRVFIGHCDEERALAEKLREILEASETVSIEATVLPGEPLPAEQNAEVVTHGIDKSHFFIPLYTEKGRKNQWVNQELGYAFCGLLRKDVHILPIYENRDHLQGLLNARSDNIHRDFNLKGKKDAEEVFKKVREYLEKTYKSPIELDYTQEKPKREDDKYLIRAVLSISNDIAKTITEAFLSLVVPEYVTIDSEKTILQPFGPGGWESITGVIPDRFKQKIRVKNRTKIVRYCYRLVDLLGPNVYDLGLDFRAPSTFNRFTCGIYLCAPMYGCVFYELIVYRSGPRNWKPRNQKDEYIEIPPLR